MSNSLWSTFKKISINLVPICPPNPLLHPSVHDYPIKNVFSFTSRLSKESKRKEEIYLSRTVLLLTFTSSIISELSRGFAAMPVCYGVNGLFCLSLLFFFFFFNDIFRFHFVHYHPWSNMHTCTFSFLFFFFLKRKISHSSSHPFICRPFTITPIYLSI